MPFSYAASGALGCPCPFSLSEGVEECPGLPLPSCHERPGRMGPIVAAPLGTALCFSVRPAVASVSGLLWSQGTVPCSRAALLFRRSAGRVPSVWLWLDNDSVDRFAGLSSLVSSSGVILGEVSLLLTRVAECLLTGGWGLPPGLSYVPDPLGSVDLISL